MPFIEISMQNNYILCFYLNWTKKGLTLVGSRTHEIISQYQASVSCKALPGDWIDQCPLRKYKHKVQAWFTCDAQKTTIVTTDVVSVDAAMASMLS